MHNRHQRYRIILSGLTLAAILALSLGLPAARAKWGVLPETVIEEGQYFTKSVVTTADGTQLGKMAINGPAAPPAGYDRSSFAVPTPVDEAAVFQLTVPAYDWSFGCSATSAAMIAAYWDRSGYLNMYTGPTDYGMMPMDSSSWGTFDDGTPGGVYGQCPLTASRDGLDGRVGKGSIDDYWVAYMTGAVDPFITGAWTEHAWGTAVGDYMKTSQYNYGNDDGSTTFYYWLEGYQLTCSDMAGYGIDIYDGAYGRKLFYEARGYTVTDCYTQATDNAATEIGQGFTFAQYKAEIDAGRPVMIHVSGHTMVGVGYDDSTQTVYLHDTWDYNTWTMPWGGSYYGMEMWGVSIVNLAPVYFLSVFPSGTGTGSVTSTPAGIRCYPDCDEGYTQGTVVKLTATPDEGSAFTGWSGACGGVSTTCYVTMSAAKSVTATFTANPAGTYYLSTVKSGSGSIASTPAGISCPTDCGEFFNSGTSVKLVATASAGYVFTGWSGACGGTGTTCYVPMTKNKTVTATFLAVPAGKYYLGVKKAGSGTVVSFNYPGISCGTDCSEFYNSGLVIRLKATPAAGYIVSWSGACGGSSLNCYVTMSNHKFVKATFTMITRLEDFMRTLAMNPFWRFAGD